MKIIYLDIDGVLNSEPTHAEAKKLNKAKVDLLYQLVSETSAKIVITSSWRFLRSIEEMQEQFNLSGYRGEVPIIGTTEKVQEVSRGKAIKKFRKSHPELDIKSYVILDDRHWDELGPNQIKHLVKVDGKKGLTSADIIIAKHILE